MSLTCVLISVKCEMFSFLLMVENGHGFDGFALEPRVAKPFAT